MRKFEHVKAVMFDLDNTLIVRAMSLAKVAKYAMRFFFPGREEEYPALEALFCRCYISGYDRHEECFYTFKAESGMDEGIAYPLFKKMWDFYYPFCTTRDPGVETVLRLKERGYNVSILTNGPLVQQNAKIDAAGFRPWFSEITVSEAIGVAKPDPEAFYIACRNTGVLPEETVYVGDYGKNDIAGARAAGMPTIWYGAYMTWDEAIERADAEIFALPELLALLPGVSEN
ncbi:MAG: HAD family hydrolase [Oscillospiraceae bacterium]|nr:HAD family hydrolase [Oscillospiraceae bacterium]